MAYTGAARRYAQAAFTLALEGGDLSRWRQDLADIAQVLVESPAARVLADERVPLAERLRVVERSLDVQPLALNLARVLVSRGRSTIAGEVAEAFDALADEHEGIARATVTTAVELAPEDLARIERALGQSTGKRVRAQANTDPALIGGLVVRVGDRLLDGSVRTRLRRLRRQLQGAR